MELEAIQIPVTLRKTTTHHNPVGGVSGYFWQYSVPQMNPQSFKDIPMTSVIYVKELAFHCIVIFFLKIFYFIFTC